MYILFILVEHKEVKKCVATNKQAQITCCDTQNNVRKFHRPCNIYQSPKPYTDVLIVFEEITFRKQSIFRALKLLVLVKNKN